MTGKENPGFKGENVWILDVPIPKSEKSVNWIIETINTALKRLGKDIDDVLLKPEDIVDLSAEWTAIKSETSTQSQYRLGLANVGDLSQLSDLAKFEMLTNDTEEDKVILHCHGGGFMYIS
jgi:hypothetical protein